MIFEPLRVYLFLRSLLHRRSRYKYLLICLFLKMHFYTFLYEYLLGVTARDRSRQSPRLDDPVGTPALCPSSSGLVYQVRPRRCAAWTKAQVEALQRGYLVPLVAFFQPPLRCSPSRFRITEHQRSGRNPQRFGGGVKWISAFAYGWRPSSPQFRRLDIRLIYFG